MILIYQINNILDLSRRKKRRIIKWQPNELPFFSDSWVMPIKPPPSIHPSMQRLTILGKNQYEKAEVPWGSEQKAWEQSNKSDIVTDPVNPQVEPSKSAIPLILFVMLLVKYPGIFLL